MPRSVTQLFTEGLSRAQAVPGLSTEGQQALVIRGWKQILNQQGGPRDDKNKKIEQGDERDCGPLQMW